MVLKNKEKTLHSQNVCVFFSWLVWLVKLFLFLFFPEYLLKYPSCDWWCDFPQEIRGTEATKVDEKKKPKSPEPATPDNVDKKELPEA